jgi:WD40 repeat protein
VLLAGLYVAGVGLLAKLLPYQPRIQFPVDSRPPVIVGFSPDGRTLATTAGVIHLSPTLVDDNSKFMGKPFQFWNVADDRDPTTSLQLSERTDLTLWNLHFNWSEFAGRRPVFWECAAIRDCRNRLAQLFPVTAQVRETDVQRDDSEYLISSDGRLAVFQLPGSSSDSQGTTWVIERPRGRLMCELRGEYVGKLGPGPGIITTLQTRSQCPKLVIRYRETESGRELFRSEWDEVPGDWVELSPDCRWLLASRRLTDGPACVVFDLKTKERRLTIRDLAGHLFALQDRILVTDHASDNETPHLEFWDLALGTQCGEYRATGDASPTPHALSPDGKMLVVALDDYGPMILSKWPWLESNLDKLGLRPNQSGAVLIDAANGHEIARLPGGPVSGAGGRIEPGVAFSDDGQQLAVAGCDGIVRIWSLPLRPPWGRVLTFATVPAAIAGFLILLLRGRRASAAPLGLNPNRGS